MESQNPQYFLTDAEGHRVPVSEEIYTAYWRYTNKEDYFMRLLKEELFVYNPEKQIATFLPSREDSYERLMEEGEEFACEQKPVEDLAVNAAFLKKLMQGLTEQEKQMLHLIFVQQKSEREASTELKVGKTKFRRMRAALFAKCRRIMGDTS